MRSFGNNNIFDMSITLRTEIDIVKFMNSVNRRYLAYNQKLWCAVKCNCDETSNKLYQKNQHHVLNPKN